MVIILVLLGVLYTHYKEMEQTLVDTHKKANRQIQLTVNSWHEQALIKNKKIKLLENQMVNMEEHHKKELEVCVAFYMTALEQARNK